MGWTRPILSYITATVTKLLVSMGCLLQGQISDLLPRVLRLRSYVLFDSLYRFAETVVKMAVFFNSLGQQLLLWSRMKNSAVQPLFCINTLTNVTKHTILGAMHKTRSRIQCLGQGHFCTLQGQSAWFGSLNNLSFPLPVPCSPALCSF